MTNQFDEPLDRITHVPGMMGGRATIRGIRVTVEMILNQLAAGQTINELLSDLPYLEKEDILQAIRYGSWLVHQEQLEKALESADLRKPFSPMGFRSDDSWPASEPLVVSGTRQHTRLNHL